MTEDDLLPNYLRPNRVKLRDIQPHMRNLYLEVIVIGNGLRAATTRRTALEPLTDRQAQPATTG